jgi:tryptophanyl-tRNA synthetase
MSLKTPTQKMSKSDPSVASRILLTDTPDQIASKIRKATMDSIHGITYEPLTRHGVANLIHILSCFTKSTPTEIAEKYASLSNQAFKNLVAEAIIEKLEPIRLEIMRLEKEKEYVEAVLRKGQIRAAKIAEETMTQVNSVVGMT